MITKIDSLLEGTAAEYLQLLSSFTWRQFNIVPFDRSWTAGQVADHVNKSNAALLESLNAHGEKTKRNVEEKVGSLKTALLNFENKFKSPEFILPQSRFLDKEETLLTFETQIKQLQQAANTIDLSELISHPVLGEITKIEILHFVVFHTKRHINQLANIAKALAKQNSVHQVQ